MGIDWVALELEAKRVRERAHAPYSRYAVGCAIQVASGAVFRGCNVENASFGLSICAERSALLQMVAAGERSPLAAVIVTRGPVAAAPCGVCRQSFAEFALEMDIRLVVAADESKTQTVRLSELLPYAFRAESLDP